MGMLAGKGPGERRSRRQYTEEFEAGAVRLVSDEGKTVAEVARDLDLTASARRTCVERRVSTVARASAACSPPPSAMSSRR